MKTFLKVGNVLLPLALFIFLSFLVCSPFMKKEFTPASKEALVKTVENAMPQLETRVPKEGLRRITSDQISSALPVRDPFRAFLAAKSKQVKPAINMPSAATVANKVDEKKSAVKFVKPIGIKLHARKRSPNSEAQIQLAIEQGIKRLPYMISHYGDIIEDTCPRKGIDPDLEYAKIGIESQGYNNTNVVSDSGALFLEQIMPKTAIYLLSLRGIIVTSLDTLKKMLLDPHLSISLGTDHYLISMQVFNDPVKALIAYNAGNDHVVSQILKFGGDVEVDYYREIYGIYSYLKQHPELRNYRGSPLDQAMRAPREEVLIANVN